MITSATPHLDSLKRDGYVIVRNIIPPHLLLALQAASKYTTDKARTGKWPYVRTVPKQYPPWPEWQPGDNIWGIQHLLHPDMAMRDVFAEVYFSDYILDVVKELVGLSPTPAITTTTTTSTTTDTNTTTINQSQDENLVMELFNLLISPTTSTSPSNPNSTPFSLQWHRDDIKPTLTPTEEHTALLSKTPGGRQLHAQYNIALTPRMTDTSLIVIPGSHARARTQTERDADPYAEDLPGQICVRLNAGDAVFYDSNILHRGVYEGVPLGSDEGRMTLHGSVGLFGYGNERARQVLQHAVGTWVGRAEFRALGGGKAERAEGMRKRLVELGTEMGDGLGYSLDG